jgi:hypothetical protein
VLKGVPLSGLGQAGHLLFQQTDLVEQGGAVRRTACAGQHEFQGGEQTCEDQETSAAVKPDRLKRRHRDFAEGDRLCQ